MIGLGKETNLIKLLYFLQFVTAIEKWRVRTGLFGRVGVDENGSSGCKYTASDNNVEERLRITSVIEFAAGDVQKFAERF